MTDLLVGGSAWWAIPAAVFTFGAVFGFFPGFVLRLLVLLYPADDPRRRELIAELYVLGRMERIEWVFQQLETALFEGVSARREQRRDRRRGDQAEDSTEEDNEASGAERHVLAVMVTDFAEGDAVREIPALARAIESYKDELAP